MIKFFSDLESVRGRNLLKILERAILNSYWHKAFDIYQIGKRRT